MSNRHSLEPPKSSSSSRLSKEDRSVKERVEILITRLDRTKDILLHECSKGDRFGNLALGTLEKTLKELVPAIKLIEQSSDINEESQRPQVGYRSRDQAVTSKERKEEEEETVPSKDRRNGRSTYGQREDTTAQHTRQDRLAKSDSNHGGDNEISSPLSRSHSSITKRDDPLPSTNDNFSDIEDRPAARIESRQSSSSRRQTDSSSPIPPSSRPLPVSRPASRISGDSSTRRKEEDVPSTRNTISKFFNRAKDAVSPSINVKKEPQLSDTDTPLSPPHSSRSASAKPDNKARRRQSSVASDSSTAAPPKPASTDSRRRRTAKPQAPSSDDDEPPSREALRSRSRAGGADRTSSRARLGRTEEARKALEMASAPPGSSDEEVDRSRTKRERKKKIVLDQVKIMKVIARESDLATQATLAQVSKGYEKVVQSLLYSSITSTSLRQVNQLVSSIESNLPLGELVTSLKLTTLDTDSSEDPSSVLPTLQNLLSLLPNLINFNEDFTSSEWDVQILSRDYPLTSSASTRQLTTFFSKRCWWEIGAINEFLLSQPELESLVFGGATMDRDWEGGKLKSLLLSSPRTNSSIECLSIAQIMHEDTLAVLLLLSPQLKSLNIGFQSLGPSDDDTPLSSIPPALKPVSSTLTHLTLIAPPNPSSSRVSEDTSTLLSDLLPLLHTLESLSFQETLHPLPIPIATSQTFLSLPPTLKSLKVRQLFSVSTGNVLGMLGKPESIPVLEEMDLEWAEAREGEREDWWKERHSMRIREACREFGIKCEVGKGERKLTIG